MFAYCAGNPINYVDNSGHKHVAASNIVGASFSASTTNANSLPPKGEPNSSQTLLNPDGTPKQKRWYDPDGNAERDRDYNHAGDMPFPHDHVWDNGKRGKEHLPPSPDYEFSMDPLMDVTIMVTYTVGIVYIVANDATGVGVADNLLLGPLANGICEVILKLFR